MKRRLPEFKSARDLVSFIDDPTVDLFSYNLDTIGEPAEVTIDEGALRLQEDAEYGRGPRLRPVTMRLDEPLVRALKRVAVSKGLSYQTLARMWLRERTIDELRSAARPRRRRKIAAKS